MDERGPWLDQSAPMVLRRVPPERRDLARAMTAPAVEGGGGCWWEWVDAAADPRLPAAAVALTDVEPGGSAVLSALGVHGEDDEDDEAYDDLLQALLAALRRRSVDSLVIRSTDRRVVRALLAAGFGPDADVDDRFVVAL
jgi:hypothetical protein